MLTHAYQDCLEPDFFQNNMSKLVQDMEYVTIISNLDDFLILTNSSSQLSITVIRVNISKSKFFAEQIEYLGYWITRQGI
jgi:hypothetical protein